MRKLFLLSTFILLLIGQQSFSAKMPVWMGYSDINCLNSQSDDMYWQCVVEEIEYWTQNSYGFTLMNFELAVPLFKFCSENNLDPTSKEAYIEIMIRLEPFRQKPTWKGK